MKVVFFTAGTKGAGHLVRGAAIGRALERAGFDGEFAIVAPVKPPFPALLPVLDQLGTEIVPIDPAEVTDPARAPGSPLAERLRALAPDLVLVDMFWVPLRYILDELDARAWLLVRSCPPVWLDGAADMPFVPGQYDRILAIEPIAHPRVALEPIDPIVICNRDALRTRAELCERFGIAGDGPIIAVSHAGLRGEIDSLKTLDRVGPTGTILRFDLYAPSAVFPLAPWLAAADEVHCSAGYNSYWEARWLGYAQRTRITAIARTIDDPVWRVKRCGGHVMRENGADVIARAIVRG